MPRAVRRSASWIRTKAREVSAHVRFYRDVRREAKAHAAERRRIRTNDIRRDVETLNRRDGKALDKSMRQSERQDYQSYMKQHFNRVATPAKYFN